MAIAARVKPLKKLRKKTSTKISSDRRKLLNSTRVRQETRKPVTVHKKPSKPDFGEFSISGNKISPDILFVVDPLYASENKSGSERPAITKPQREFIGRYLANSVIEYDNVAFLTAAPPAEQVVFERDKAIGEHLKGHRDQFTTICKYLQPKIIVAMGRLGARQVYGRAVQITKARGLVNKEEAWGNIPVLPSLGIGHVMRYPENVEIFRADMETLKRVVSDDYELTYREKIKTEYKWVDDLQFVIKAKPEELVVDIEGVGLDMHDPKTWLLSVQLCWEEGKAYAINIRDLSTAKSRKLVNQLKTILENKKTKCIGHNLKFDFGMIREKLGITIANYAWDTMVMAHIIDENMLTFNLADLTRRYVPDMAGYSDEFDRDPIHQGKSRMDLVPMDKLLMYGCGDVDATLRLYHRLKEEFDKDPYFNRYYENIIGPGLRAFCDIERYGFTINKNELKSFEKYLRAKQKEDHAKIMKMVPKVIQDEFREFENHRDSDGNVIKREVKFKLSKPSFLVAMCFTHPKGLKLKAKVFTKSTASEKDPKKRVPSVSTKDHFPYFEGVPFIDAMIEYLKSEKLLNTYVGSEDNEDGTLTGFYKYIKDGKIRPSYLFTGTDTGRLSSRDPNGQNFPKRGEGAKRYRKMFVAPKGWVLVSADLSQAELRIAAFLADEKTMLKYYRNGVDLHAATAAKVMGKALKDFLKLNPDIIAKNRFNAKAVNFGFLYGMWWKKFMSYAKTQYGVDYTEKEAEQIRKDFFDLYPGLLAWHRNTQDQIMRDGYIRSPFGRRRSLPSVYSNDEMVSKSAMRKGINAPVQSFASDLGVWAIARLHQAGIPEDKFRVIGFVHDDIICMAREEYAGIAARTLRKFMETSPLKEVFDIDMPVDIVAEAAIGYNLSEMVEANEFISDKSVKTVEDIKNAIRKKIDSIPADNEKKRSSLEKEISKLERVVHKPAEKVKITTRKRKLRLISKNKSTEQRNAEATKTVKAKPEKAIFKPRSLKIKRASGGGSLAGRKSEGSRKREEPRNDTVQKRAVRLLRKKRG